MGIFSNRVEKSELHAGDHIYTWRVALIYAHHGIYMGEDTVVHFTCSSHVPTCSVCEMLPSGEGRNIGVIKTCLDCFLRNGSLFRYGYGVSRVAFAMRYGGTCNMAESGPVEVVVERALHLLRNGFGEYHLLNRNCEDFATYCKTGQCCNRNGRAGGRFGQASSVFGRAAAAVFN